MRNTFVYDLPTRIFHWLFSLLFVGAFFIAKTVDDENSLFSVHMMMGLLMAFIVILRLYWGIFGTKYSRFYSFALHPSDLFSYFKGLIDGSKRTWNGHNPASSWAAITMFILTLGLAATGYLMTTGHKEAFENIHEVLANAFLTMVLLHISGVLFHMIRHKDGIAMSMIDGHKKTSNLTGSVRPHYFASVIYLLLITVFSGYLIKQYNSTTGTLSFFGHQMTLIEAE